MADTEKVSMNMSVVDLGHIDLLVDQGFYSSRTDFLRAAIRSQLERHDEVVKQTVVRRTIAMGAVVYDRASLERFQSNGEMVKIKVLGLVNLANDITPELARATIQSVEVFGAFRASPAVKEALADRIVRGI
ncbi:MAG: CopG family transcriptional regulator [Herpetosiphon sp.]|nr:CopG family transcriptional regulator [Herpetosiphon sp.]